MATEDRRVLEEILFLHYRHFPAGFTDLVVCNAVYGWGLDSAEDCDAARTNTPNESPADHCAASSLLIAAAQGTRHAFKCRGYEVWTPLFESLPAGDQS